MRRDETGNLRGDEKEPVPEGIRPERGDIESGQSRLGRMGNENTG